MLTVRCTKKLLDRMRVAPEAEPPKPTTVLGDWYANLLQYGRQQLILCVSERSLLPVLLTANDAKSLPSRLPGAIFDVLKRLDVPLSGIGREMDEMLEPRIARTANRSVLGIMNDFAFAIPYRLEEGASLNSIALELATTPCSPLGRSNPQATTEALFSAFENKFTA